VDSLAKNDEVVTVGGMAGRIAEIGDNFVLVEIADGIQVKVRRSAVESVMPKGTLKDL
jgi:preprotein translocase subunit YajC